jgi:hypothetical protein
MSMTRCLWLGLLGSFAALTVASTPATAQQQQKPNILFVMGDDIGWMQPSIYHRGLMVGERGRGNLGQGHRVPRSQ